jgi:hypothetical protein
MVGNVEVFRVFVRVFETLEDQDGSNITHAPRHLPNQD